MMAVGQKVDVEHRGNVIPARITKVVNKECCVLSWFEGKIRKYNVLYTREQIEKGRVRYESAITK